MSGPAGLGLALGLRNLAARLQTTSFAVAALAVTVSMLVGITLLVGSFRATLVTWLDVTVRADVYVTTESWVRAGNEALLERDLLRRAGRLPGVAAVEEQRRLRVRTADGRHQIWLNGIRVAGLPGAELATRLPLLDGRSRRPWPRRLERGRGAHRRAAGPQGRPGRGRHAAAGRARRVRCPCRWPAWPTTTPARAARPSSLMATLQPDFVPATDPTTPPCS